VTLPEKEETSKTRKIPAKSRNSARTKEDIIQVAIQEFSEKGFLGARVESIAKLANVNMRMIYHYYESKEKLYISTLERVYRDVRESELNLQIEDMRPELAIRTLIRFTFDHFQKHPELINLVMGENLLRAKYVKQSDLVPTMSERLQGLIGMILDRGKESGNFRKDIDAGQFWFTLFSLCWVPVSNMHTMSWSLQCDLSNNEWKEKRKIHIEDMLLHYLSVF